MSTVQDTRATRETPPETLELYFNILGLLEVSKVGDRVFPIQEKTTVVIKELEKDPYPEIHFYRFSDREGPVAKLTGRGEYMSLLTYQLTPSIRKSILSCDVHETLKRVECHLKKVHGVV